MECKDWQSCKTYAMSKEGRWLLVLLAIIFFPFFVIALLWHYLGKFSRK